MKLDEGLLLSGVPLKISGLGTIKSPKLKEVYRDFESVPLYNMIIGVLSSDVKYFREMIKVMTLQDDYSDLTDLDYEEITKFNLITHSPNMRELFKMALSFFIVERINYCPEENCFIVLNSVEGKDNIIGYINDQNFITVQDLILQLTYQESEDPESLKFGSEKAKKIWEECHEYESNHIQSGAKDCQLDNIISKLSVGNVGYTLFNIYELTVYQLYDQFNSYANNRVALLCENAYAHNGGEQFDMNMWLHRNKK